MSENGPREGTRDLPRRDPEAGFRAADENSAAGVTYRRLAQSLRRRQAELVALAREGGSPSTIAAEYQSKHPLETPVSRHEVAAAIRGARSRPAPPSS